jgi:hypothetical protein
VRPPGPVSKGYSYHKSLYISCLLLPRLCPAHCNRLLVQHRVKYKKLSSYRHAGAKREKYSSYSFLISALDGSEWSASLPRRTLPPSPPGKDPGTHWIGGCVGLRAGLDTEARGKIFCLCRGSNPGRVKYKAK